VFVRGALLSAALDVGRGFPLKKALQIIETTGLDMGDIEVKYRF